MQPSIGNQIKFASEILLPAKRFEEYFATLAPLLADDIHYIDPVHELRGKKAVLEMLAKYVPRAANDSFRFELIYNGAERVIWKWRIVLKIRFTPFKFVIHGLVEAQISNGKICYQREYYDPMESISVIPLVGFLYKLALKFG